jgi:ribose transport system substrate-binding protein
MNTKRSSALLLAALLVTAVVAAAQTGIARSTSAKKIQVAYFDLALANTYETAALNGAKAAAKKYNASLTVFDANFDTTKQYAEVQDAITTKKYQAFVVSPNNGAALVPLLKQAVSAGIKITCHDGVCGPKNSGPGYLRPQIPGVVAHVGFDFVGVGGTLADLMAKACAGKNPCKAVYFVGAFSYANDISRLARLKQELKKFPNVKLVAVQEGKYLGDPSSTAMQNVLQAHPDVSVFASAGDQMTLGAERAVNGAGLKGKVALIGSAASKLGVQAVVAKRWFADTIQLPFTEGFVATKLAILAARGAKGLPKTVRVDRLAGFPNLNGIGVLTQQNAHRFHAEWSG